MQIDKNWAPARKAGVPYRVFGRGASGTVWYAGPFLFVFGRRG